MLVHLEQGRLASALPIRFAASIRRSPFRTNPG
jgi:hypothetical protein